MGIKSVLFLVVGAAAVYGGVNFPVVDTPELQIHKNLFTSSYTWKMEKEGIVMQFDKRYENELSATTDVLKAAIKLDSKNAAANEEIREKANERIREALKFK